MPFQNILILIVFVGLSFLFFGLAVNNGFWFGDDFVYLEHSLGMMDGSHAAFDSATPFKFQPLVYAIHYILFKWFYFSPSGYFIFNILLHGFNSFLVYLLVHTLLRDRHVALLSGALFVFTVGSYGKSIMIASGLEDLVITCLTLLTMIFYFRNALSGGRFLSGSFLLALLFFLASMFTRSTSFSILGAFLAFNYFYRNETEKRVFNLNFAVLVILAMAALIIKATVFSYTPQLYTRNPGPALFVYYAAKNLINYPVRMIFPIHTTHLVAEAGAAVKYIYQLATGIRILLALTVISYSLFGFIFGNRTIRFFIAWTYIMVLPFAFFQFPYDWINMRHLYLVSVGFVMILSAGGVYCSRLIAHHRWRRFVPLMVPLFFVLLSRFIVTQLDRSYEIKSASPATLSYKEGIAEKYPNVIIEDGDLELIP
jgi:hypothetical protein